MAAKDSKTLEELDSYFTFKTDSGDTYSMPLKTIDVMTPGWVRRNRRRDETDYFMTLLECLAGGDPDGPKLEKDDAKLGADILKVLDKLAWAEHKRVQQELLDHIGVTLGE